MTSPSSSARVLVLVESCWRRLGTAWLLSLSLAVSAAELTAETAAERYQHWQELPAAEQAEALADLAEYYSNPDAVKALQLAEAGLQRLDARAPPDLAVRLYNSHAFTLFATGKNSQALTDAITAEQLATSNNLLVGRGRARTTQGYIFNNAGLTERAMIAHHGALQDFDAINDSRNKARALRNLAGVLIRLRQFEQAENYIKQIAAMIEPGSANEPIMQAAIGDLRGHLASNQGRSDEALKQHRHALHWAEIGNDLIGQHVYHAAISTDLLQLNRPAEALLMTDRGLELIRQTGNDFRDINLFQTKAMALVALKRFGEAEQLLQQSLRKAEQRNDQVNMVSILSNLAELEQARGNFQQAFSYLEAAQAAELRSSDQQNVERTAILDATFDSERKSRQIAQLENETRIQQLELKERRQQLIVAITLALFLTAVSFIYFQRRQHKQELARQQALTAKLQELDGVKDRMLANTSHELRTPLNGIVGLSELLMAEDPSPHAREYLQLIADSGRRLTAVVSELLETARLREGTLRLEPQQVSLTEPLRKALLICQPMAQQKGLQLRDQLAPQTPPVWADPARVEQMLINLITNAIRFTERGHVTVSALVSDGEVTLSVQDTGIGIPAALQEKIFEPFVQGDDSMARRHQGVGLGLAICKDLVLLHGGRIGVESTEGQGSRFWFTLPRARQQGI